MIRLGQVVVLQADHAAQCADLGRAWGGERFGAASEDAILAAAQHELGWDELDAHPRYDADALPLAVNELHFSVYMPAEIDGPRRLAETHPYPALLAAKCHASLYRRPHPIGGLVRADGRRIRRFLAEHRALQAELQARTGVADAQLERDWRLVRAWDGLSHDLLFERTPTIRRDVPDANGELVELRLERAGDAISVDPWPFAADELISTVAGQDARRGTPVTLRYVLRPG